MTKKETDIIYLVNKDLSYGRFFRVATRLGVSRQYINEVCKRYNSLVKPLKPKTFVCRICEEEKTLDCKVKNKKVCVQ